MGFSKSSSKREVYSDTIISQETRKTSIDNLTLKLKQLEKEEQNPPKVSRKKEIIKIRAEISEKEMKETLAKINKTKSRLFEKINKLDKPLTRLIKEKREKNQINKIRNENGEITTNNTNKNDHKRLLSATICQYNGQLGRNGQILRKVPLYKTEPGRNGKS